MDEHKKPLCEWTLWDAARECIDADGDCKKCLFYGGSPPCPFGDGAPCCWVFEDRPRWTGEGEDPRGEKGIMSKETEASIKKAHLKKRRAEVAALDALRALAKLLAETEMREVL